MHISAQGANSKYFQPCGICTKDSLTIHCANKHRYTYTSRKNRSGNKGRTNVQRASCRQPIFTNTNNINIRCMRMQNVNIHVNVVNGVLLPTQIRVYFLFNSSNSGIV